MGRFPATCVTAPCRFPIGSSENSSDNLRCSDSDACETIWCKIYYKLPKIARRPSKPSSCRPDAIAYVLGHHDVAFKREARGKSNSILRYMYC
jgi:hypothetical protein